MNRGWPLVLLAGCASAPEPTIIREPVEVHVAVPVHCEPPAELMAPLTVDLPEFVPASPPATSGLTPDGERKLMTLIWTLTQRLEAWKAHAAECRG